MTRSFLDTLIEVRFEALREQYGTIAAPDLERLACCAKPPRDVLGAFRDRADVAVIAEVKKASPSEGPIAPDCEASKQALHYQDGGATMVSVLAEPRFFGGSFGDVSDVSDAVDIPVLAKDIVVDPVQLFLARSHGADAILLMVSVLGDRTAEFLDLASTLGLTALVEVHGAEELGVALAAGAEFVGVNSRDLRTLEVDPAKVRSVIASAKEAGVIVVAESGVRTRADVQGAAEAGADAVLVGTVLMRARFPEDVLEEITGVARVARAG